MSENFISYAKKQLEHELQVIFGDTSNVNCSRVASELIDDINWETDLEFLHKGFAWLAWKYKTRTYDPIYS